MSAASDASGAPSPAPSSAPSAPVVLLVEDDESLATLLDRNLTAHGYRVTVAASVEAATAALGNGLRPAVVLLDINLPGETGWAILGSPALAAAGDPPVIVASAMSIAPRRLREHGVAGYLPKPFALDTLRSTLERVIQEPRPA